MDMDMFYAAVEMRDDSSLETKPMAVGGNSMLVRTSCSTILCRIYPVNDYQYITKHLLVI